MRTSTTARRAARGIALVAAAATAAAMAPGAALGAEPDATSDTVTPIITDLIGPRGISVDSPRRVYYTEADGTLSRTILSGVRAGTKEVAAVPASFVAPALSQYKKSRGHLLTPGGDPGTPGATLYTWVRTTHEATPIADIAAYQATDPDPNDLEGLPTTSNPYGVATLPDNSALVADAEGNDLLHVYPNGEIETVARLLPRMVTVPDEFEGLPDVPPPGTVLPAEAVATSVTVGSDGYYYVGELRGFPATPGTSQVWRIEPGAVDAVCDPDNPYVGACQRFADGFTSIVDLAPGTDGDIYVLELVKQSWFQWEAGIAEPIGGLYRVSPSGESVELAADQLILPGGVDTNRSFKKVYVAGPIFETGSILEIKQQ